MEKPIQLTLADRMDRFVAAGLYLVTSEVMSAGRSTPDVVAAALRGGCRLIQLREKDMAIQPFLRLAKTVRQQTADAGALLIINDRLDVALCVGADGVHLGQGDLPVQDARGLAPDLIIGASSHSVDEAVAAEAAGASYVNIGPLFPTNTKEWRADFLGIDGMQAISPHVTIPFTVMGGIKEHHLSALMSAGAQTIALVTAVTAASDPETATQSLLRTMAANRD